MRQATAGLVIVLGLLGGGKALAQQCEYPIVDLSKCAKRTARAGHEATVNGCGPASFTVEFPQGYGLASYREGCNDHDKCYEKCNTVRTQCDDTLARAMDAACHKAYPYPPARSADDEADHRGICLARARLYANLLRTSKGQEAYDDAQKIACECCTSGGWGGTVSYVVSGSETMEDPVPPPPNSTKMMVNNSSSTVNGTGMITLVPTSDPNTMAMTAGSGTWSQETSYGYTVTETGIKCSYESFAETVATYSGNAELPAADSGSRQATIFIADGVLSLTVPSLSGPLTGAEHRTEGGTVTPDPSMPDLTCAPFEPIDDTIPGTGMIPTVPLAVGGPIDANAPDHLMGSQVLEIGSNPLRSYEVSWDLTLQ